MDRVQPQGAADEVEGPHQGLRATCWTRPTSAVRRDTQIVIPHGERLGNVVIEVADLNKGYGDTLLIEDLEFKLPPGGIVGVIGPNGAGKTTLFRMITGQEKPDDGSIRIGETVKLGYVDQSRDALDPSKTVWEEISGGAEVVKLGKHEANTRAYCSSFNFRGGDQQQKVGNLSGGQRNRVHLAKMLKTGGNVLLLDEPTNDLDTETLAALEDALENFAGCAVIISPRPHVPRPAGDPHPRLRGRQPCRMVRGQFRGLRAGQDQAARPRSDQPAPHDVQAADAVGGILRGGRPTDPEHAADWISSIIPVRLTASCSRSCGTDLSGRVLRSA